jgi:CPA2 family monovalent cation:H+ antiporter-2
VPLLEAHLGLEASLARTAWFSACFLGLALPVLVVAVRTTNALASAVLAGPDGAAPPRNARLRALRAFLLFGLTALVGFPSATIVGASVSDASSVLVVLVILVVLGVAAFRSAREVDAEVKSAALRIAAALTSQAARESIAPHDTAGHHDDPGAPATEPSPLLAELGATERVTVERGAGACGRTLAELDLRARTGATILAIQRGQRSEALPTGKDRLEAGDVLVLAGTSDAIDRARTALHDGPAAPASPQPA